MTDDKPTNTISLAAERRTREAGARFRGRARSLDQGVGGHWGAAKEGQRNRRRPVVDRLVVPPGHGDPRPLGPGAERGGRRRACENHGEEGLEMEMMLPRRALRQLLQRFLQQRHAAKQRGIAWQLDYWQWLEIWQTSGHLHEHGRRKGEFQDV